MIHYNTSRQLTTTKDISFLNLNALGPFVATVYAQVKPSANCLQGLYNNSYPDPSPCIKKETHSHLCIKIRYESFVKTNPLTLKRIIL